MLRRLGPADYRDVPWKNGGGVTRELLRLPHPRDPERFFLRLSIATVATSGPFSSFPGVDRTLVLLDGDGVALSFGDGPEIHLDQPLRPLSFPGEAPVEARLLGGSVRDFNLMVDRGVGSATLRVVHLDPHDALRIEARGLLLVHLLAGHLQIDDEPVVAHETLLFDRAGHHTLRGSAALAIVIEPTGWPQAAES